MNPFCVFFNKFLQKCSSNRSSRSPLTWIVRQDIGFFDFQSLMMFNIDWHSPDVLMNIFTKGEKGVAQFSRVWKQTCIFLAKSLNVAVCQSRQLDQYLCFVSFLCPVHCISKDKSSFGICIVNFYSKTLSTFNDITWSVGIGPNKILYQPNRTG